MSNLKGKKILLAITGSIAAYKAAELIRLLKPLQADIKVVMTKDACEFITELSIQALSGKPVHRELLDHDSEASMSHITLAKWADLLLVAPASANILAKFAGGIADDLLSTLYLACPSPTAIVPAMNQQMWRHAATGRNKNILTERGVLFWGPGVGSQACGDTGPGRMIEPSEIIAHLEDFFAPKILSGLKIIITAGPTRELIDPVRFISNFSSGKMGYALAAAARELGAQPLLISGPTHLPFPSGVATISVQTAQEMHDCVMSNIAGSAIFIACAAVADYKPANVATQKIKKPALPIIEWEKCPDILMAVSQLPEPPFLVGFAAESENLCSHAKDKLAKKNLDMIVANLIGHPDSGFDSDFNEVTVITHEHMTDIPHMEKRQLAYKLLALIVSQYQKKREDLLLSASSNLLVTAHP